MNLQNKTSMVLAIAAALAVQCAPRPSIYEEDSYWMWPILMQYIYRSPYTGDTTTLQDRGDGSVEITKRRGYGGTAYRALLQKCPLGLTYNSGTNLCNAGQSGLFQYCSVASNACNASNGMLNNLGASQAYQACNESALLSLTWQVAVETVLLDLMRHPDRDAVFPDLQNNWYWANNTGSTTTAYVYRRTDLNESRSKTESHGVLCQYAGDFY